VACSSRASWTSHNPPKSSTHACTQARTPAARRRKSEGTSSLEKPGDLDQPAPPEGSETLRGEAQLAAADFQQVWPLLPSVRSWRAFFVFCLVVGLLVCLGGAAIDDPSPVFQLTPLVVAGVGLVVVRAARDGWLRRQLEMLGDTSMSFELDEQAVRITTANGRQRLKWTELKQYQELSEAFLLVGSELGWLLLPKRAFDPSARSLVRLLLQRHLEERTAGSSVLRVALAVMALLLFLSVWHFLSVDAPPPGALGSEPVGSAEISPPPEAAPLPPTSARHDVEQLRKSVDDLERYIEDGKK
jgi:hypothetical protein